MKSYFKYIFLTVFLFLFSTLGLEAAELHYTCNYDWSITDDFSLPLEVRIYDDKSVEFYANSKKIETNTYLSELGFSSYSYLYLNDNYYTVFVDEGTRCPNITTALSINGDSYEVSYGNIHNADNFYKISDPESKEPTINPNLSGSDKDELEGQIVKETKSCEYSYKANTMENLDRDLIIRLYMLSDGSKMIDVTKKSISGEETETREYEGKDGTTDIRVDNYLIRFFPGESSSLFRQNLAQSNNNTFSCPAANKIYIDEYIGNEFSGVKAFIVSTNLDVIKEYGKGHKTSSGDYVSPEDGTDAFYGEDSGNAIVGPETGICTDYLGEASKEGTLAHLLDRIYTLIKIGSIILVIVLSMLEFASSITKSKDNLMDVVMKFAKRLGIVIIILLLPTLIDLLGDLFGYEDILCGIK